MKTFVAWAVAIAATISVPVQQQKPIDYRFDDVKRKVVLTTPQKEFSVFRGLHAQSGDRVQTGWFSYALIASETYRAKFELFSSTDVKLAAGAPGVILSVERGRMHAMFDKLVGSEPRVVQTPGALLAVRGTQYDVEVDDAGQTTLKVTEGTVEVRSHLRAEPLLVHAGEMAHFSRLEPPQMHLMTHGSDDGHEGHGDHEGHGGEPNEPHGHGQAPPPHGTTQPPPGGHH